MPKEFLNLKNDIKSLTCSKNIVCILLFGSILFDRHNANDFDVIIVVKKVNFGLKELMLLFSSKYEKIDFDIFTSKEITEDLSFYTREFKLEYLSNGLCIYGKNIFINEWKKVNEYKYKQSLLIRNIEYLQLVRQKYYSNENELMKIVYLKKYFLRISKSLLLYWGMDNYASVNKLKSEEVIEKLLNTKIINKRLHFVQDQTLNYLFDSFEILSGALIKCKKDFDKIDIKKHQF